MTAVSLGKVAPATAGTPKQITTDTTIKANRIVFAQIPATTGKAFVGVSGLNRSTLAGALRAFLPPGASGFTDDFEVEAESGNALTVADYYVDADNNNEGVIVSYYQS